jgi:hypothetical protein
MHSHPNRRKPRVPYDRIGQSFVFKAHTVPPFVDDETDEPLRPEMLSWRLCVRFAATVAKTERGVMAYLDAVRVVGTVPYVVGRNIAASDLRTIEMR